MGVRELVPVVNLRDLVPNVFIAVDYMQTGRPKDKVVRAVGTFIRWRRNGLNEPQMLLTDVVTSQQRAISRARIVEAWYAPMGYRP